MLLNRKYYKSKQNYNLIDNGGGGGAQKEYLQEISIKHNVQEQLNLNIDPIKALLVQIDKNRSNIFHLLSCVQPFLF